MISWEPGIDGARDPAATGAGGTGGDPAALLARVGARQAASPTAQAQARLPVARPRTGAAFAAPVAVSIAGWSA